MLDIVLFLTLLGSLITIILIALIIFKGRKTSLISEEKRKAGPLRRPVPNSSSNIDDPNRRLRNRKQKASRLYRDRNKEEKEAEDDEVRNEMEDEDDEELFKDEPIFQNEAKIGVKKRRKLEAKAEKKAAREREMEEREERKQRMAVLEEIRKKEEAKREEEEKAKEEEEKRLKEEKERKEYEEYVKMKETFEIEEEGFDKNENENENENKLQIFIDYIKEQKVVLLEDLAGHFKMKTQDVINRVQSLLEDEQLTGVIDDRGKLIYITNEELKEVAKFIRQRGRVSIVEIVENSNKLIKVYS